jgi:ATP phosphoribosyltransferase regulatory subunit
LLAIEPIVLSLGNVAVFDVLIAQEALNDEQASALRQIFVKRSVPDLAVFLSNNTLKNANKFSALALLSVNTRNLRGDIGMYT